jgi:hypothetical protein
MSGDLHVVRPVATTNHDARPASPAAPQPPNGAGAPAPEPGSIGNHAIAAAYDEARLRILRALERGEIDVAEAGRRLEMLDNGEPGPSTDTADPAGEIDHA